MLSVNVLGHTSGSEKRHQDVAGHVRDDLPVWSNLIHCFKSDQGHRAERNIDTLADALTWAISHVQISCTCYSRLDITTINMIQVLLLS